MIYSNPRFANEFGGILLAHTSGTDLYVDGGPLFEMAINGDFGPVAEYIAPPPPPPQVPVSVTRFQARAALHIAGLLDQVEAAIAAGDVIDQLAWADASEFRRNSPMLKRVASEIGLTPEQVDDLFFSAVDIEA